jgi:hypothetical protein
VVEAVILTAPKGIPKKKRQTLAPGGDIDLLVAEGACEDQRSQKQVFGQKAVYVLDRKQFKFTGNNLN